MKLETRSQKLGASKGQLFPISYFLFPMQSEIVR